MAAPNPKNKNQLDPRVEKTSKQEESQTLQAKPVNPILAPILQLVDTLTQPIQTVFSLKGNTEKAKLRVQEMKERIESLEAQIEAAGGRTDTGQRFNRLR